MKIKSYTGGILLVAGTCIGAGMLALPVALASSGFLISSMWLFICWACTCLTGLYVLEANLRLSENSNFISMAKSTLGRVGESAAWLTYLLLLYSLMAAYLSAGGDLIAKAVFAISQVELNNWFNASPWIIVFGLVIYFGARFVDGLNRVLVAGLAISYVAMIFGAIPEVNVANLESGEFGHLLPALTILVTAFGYHVVIPSIRTYMHGDVKKLPKVIIIGSILPLFIYLAWNAVVFGIVPIEGADGLKAILETGRPAGDLTKAMAKILQNPRLLSFTNFFLFFAIATSFLGISFALFDFLRDGFKVHQHPMGKWVIGLVTFIPPLLYSLYFPKGFILALNYAGIFVAILHGILPALMVLFGRKKSTVSPYRAPGGLVGILVILLLSLVVIFNQAF